MEVRQQAAKSGSSKRSELRVNVGVLKSGTEQKNVNFSFWRSNLYSEVECVDGHSVPCKSMIIHATECDRICSMSSQRVTCLQFQLAGRVCVWDLKLHECCSLAALMSINSACSTFGPGKCRWPPRGVARIEAMKAKDM